MKLVELHESSNLVEELEAYWSERGRLDEGVWDSLKSGYQSIATSMTKIVSDTGRKSAVNDEGLRNIYLSELEKIKRDIDALPDKAATVARGILAKHGVKFGGVEIGRNHINRIVIIKMMRLVLFAMNQMRDNGLEWILSTAVTGGLSAIFSAILAAKDAKSVAVEFKNSSKQVQDLFKITKR